MISGYPVAIQDVALIVADTVPAGDVEPRWPPAAARRGRRGGRALEDLRLFDVYTGDQVGEGRKSLAYTLRFRAPDRTLTAEEASRPATPRSPRPPGAPAPSCAARSRRLPRQPPAPRSGCGCLVAYSGCSNRTHNPPAPLPGSARQPRAALGSTVVT